MQRFIVVLSAAATLCLAAGQANAQANCSAFNLDDTASAPLQAISNPPPQHCSVRMSNGFPIPDPACTPGAINPTLTANVLRDPHFRTGCVRSHATTEEQKASTYGAYGIPHPAHNSGQTQTGGADTLDNIWPQCGPPGVSLDERFFKEKDGVENYLAKQVKEGRMDLGEAQRGIATDWTQYLNAARQACPGGRC